MYESERSHPLSKFICTPDINISKIMSGLPQANF